jgi:hypothetical protein
LLAVSVFWHSGVALISWTIALYRSTNFEPVRAMHVLPVCGRSAARHTSGGPSNSSASPRETLAGSRSQRGGHHARDRHDGLDEVITMAGIRTKSRKRSKSA